jgi:predicted CXXCH cytochrome family protein
MGWRPTYVFVLLAILAGCMVFSQCSPQTGRHMLTFFFDGIPEQDSTLTVPSTDSLISVQKEVDDPAFQVRPVKAVLVHYPYGERECGVCHDPNSLGDMVEPQPGLCYICHEDFGHSYSSLHGPVAGGYCTACHDPHSSLQEKLLRLTGKSLCFYCHLEDDVLKNEIHTGLDEMACTDCHNPHGGSDRYILY